MPKYYPGWVMRLYYDLNKKDPVFKDLCELACKNDYLDICDAKHLPGTPFKDASKVFAMNWRFFPTLDPQVNYCNRFECECMMTLGQKRNLVNWLPLLTLLTPLTLKLKWTTDTVLGP